MSDFSPETFLQQTTVDALETKFTPLPEKEYLALCDKVEMASGQNKEGKPWYSLVLTWNITADSDPVIKQVTGLDNVRVKQRIFLDLTDGRIEAGPGKNIQLGKLREALGQNRAGQPWSPQMLQGMPARVLVKTATNKNKPDEVYMEVTQVTRLN